MNSETRKKVMNSPMMRKCAAHGKSKKAKRMQDKRELRNLGAWGIQR